MSSCLFCIPLNVGVILIAVVEFLFGISCWVRPKWMPSSFGSPVSNHIWGTLLMILSLICLIGACNQQPSKFKAFRIFHLIRTILTTINLVASMVLVGVQIYQTEHPYKREELAAIVQEQLDVQLTDEQWQTVLRNFERGKMKLFTVTEIILTVTPLIMLSVNHAVKRCNDFLQQQGGKAQPAQIQIRSDSIQTSTTIQFQG